MAAAVLRRALGAVLAAALGSTLAAAAPALAEEAEPGPPEPAAPGPFDGPAPRARGWWATAFGAAVDGDAAGFMLRLAVGRPVSARLRLDLVLTAAGQDADFPAGGEVVADVPEIRERTLYRARAFLELVASWEAGRFEPWVGAGAALVDLRAEVRGPTTVTCIPLFGCFQQTPEATDAATRVGGVAAAGANLVLSRNFLAGLELHLPLVPAARMDTIPIRTGLTRPLFVASLTWRGGAPP